MFRKKHASNSQAAPTNQSTDERRQAKVEELRAAIGPLSGRAEKFCTEACFKRYLEARNWDVEKATKMLQETLKWRASFKPEEIHWSDVSAEGETGKMYRANFQDRQGRTVIVMTPRNQNTNNHEGQLKHLVYLLENAILNLPEGQEQMAWLIDFTGYTLANSTPMKTSRETANILQNHYPERLAIGFLFNPPRLFEAFYKIIKHFLDPKTAQKVNFVYPKDEASVSLMHKYFDPEVLPVEFGGKNNIVYDHEEFSKMFLKDDVRTAEYWGFADEPGHVTDGNGRGHSSLEIVPEPSYVAAHAG